MSVRRIVLALLAVATVACNAPPLETAGAPPAPAASGCTEAQCAGTADASVPSAERPPAPPGGACAIGKDCTSGVCLGGVCQAPSPTDGVKNGDETDVDCGGAQPNAKRCAAGKGCVLHTDCESDGCAYDGKCALSRSCVLHHGGDTCGAYESDDPMAAGAHESCCVAPTVPANTTLNVASYRLDKYTVTAGRMRAFVERTQGDMLTWIQANRPTWWDAEWDKALPRSLGEAYWMLGPGDDDAVQGDPEIKITKRGCWQSPHSYNTFRLPDQFIAENGLPGQAYSADILDEKALNCTTLPVYAAFCAWDGGYIPTGTEVAAAWGKERYPWGSGPGGKNGTPVNPAPSINDYVIWSSCLQENVGGGTVPSGNNTLTYCSVADLQYVYRYPVDGQAASGIAAPGRRPKGNGPYGHADLIGNLAANSLSPGVMAAVGSWQGHFNTWDPVEWGTLGNPKAPAWELAPTPTPAPQKTFSGYWASGVRCARKL